MTFDVVVVGSLNLDFVVRVERHPLPGETLNSTSYNEYPGGKGLNQAVAAARGGASVALVGTVGNDDAGRRLRDIVRAEGIDDRWLSTQSDVETGRALITVDAAGENSIVVVAGANALTEWPAEAPTARVVIAQLEVPQPTIIDAFRASRASGALTILNPAPATGLAADLLAHCSIIVPNEHELALLGGVDELVELVSVVITTRGAQGATVDTLGAGTTMIAPLEVTPIDTTGAGDAFCGHLAAMLATGATAQQAAEVGAAAGALATTRAGAVPSLPHRSEVESALDLGPA